MFLRPVVRHMVGAPHDELRAPCGLETRASGRSQRGLSREIGRGAAQEAAPGAQAPVTPEGHARIARTSGAGGGSVQPRTTRELAFAAPARTDRCCSVVPAISRGGLALHSLRPSMSVHAHRRLLASLATARVALANDRAVARMVMPRPSPKRWGPSRSSLSSDPRWGRRPRYAGALVRLRPLAVSAGRQHAWSYSTGLPLCRRLSRATRCLARGAAWLGRAVQRIPR